MRRVAAYVIWFSVVFWYWKATIPLVPTWSFPLQPGQTVLGVQETGEIQVARQSRGRAQDRFERRGPLEIWDMTEPRKLRELFTEDDELLKLTRRLCLVRRDGRLSIVDLTEDETLSALPESQHVDWYCPVDDYRFLYRDGTALRLFDANLPGEVWASEGYWQEFFTLGGRFARARMSDKQRAIVLDLANGQPDPRFDRFNSIGLVTCSNDGRFVGVHANGKFIVCDSETLQERWSVSRLPAWEEFQFNSKGDEVTATYADWAGHVTTARWNAADGTVLAPRPNSVSLNRGFSESISDQYALQWALVDRPLARTVNQWLTSLPFLRVPLSQSYRRIVNQETGKTVGILEQDSWPWIVPDGSGFIIERDGRADCYTLPPKRNWRWLATWSLVPPTVVEGLRRLWQRRRRRLATPSPIDSAS